MIFNIVLSVTNMCCRLLLVFAIVIFGGLLITPAVAVADTGMGKSTPIAQAGSDAVTISQKLELTPETPGSIRVTETVDVTLKLKEFELFVPADGKKLKTDGFSRATAEDPMDGFKMYAWDGNTRSPSITYRLDVNSTRTSRGVRDQVGYETVDAGEWAIISTPGNGWGWTASEDIDVTTDRRIAGPGVVKDGFAFLGEHDIRMKSANGQRFRLVIPKAANLTESPAAILNNITYASRKLRVGERDEDVVMIAAPTPDGINWSHGGTAHDSVFWAIDEARLDHPGNTWIHEYVHTRQDFNQEKDFSWFVEGSAEYYAALYTLQQEQIGFQQFQKHFIITEPYQAKVALTNTKSASPPQYTKGGLVAAGADKRIRLATNGSVSLADIFRRLNSDNEPASNSDFIRYIGLYSNNAIESDVQAATTTSEIMSSWDKNEYTQAFGEEPHEMKSPDTGKTAQDSKTRESNGWLRFILALVAVNSIAYGIFKIYNR